MKTPNTSVTPTQAAEKDLGTCGGIASTADIHTQRQITRCPECDVELIRDCELNELYCGKCGLVWEDEQTETATVEAKENTRTGHTPGPWIVEPGTNRFYVRSGTRFVASTMDDRQGEIDARLIAGAPELLWFARRILRELPAKRDWLDPDLEKIGRTAIAKAEGKQ